MSVKDESGVRICCLDMCWRFSEALHCCFFFPLIPSVLFDLVFIVLIDLHSKVRFFSERLMDNDIFTGSQNLNIGIFTCVTYMNFIHFPHVSDFRSCLQTNM